MSTKFEPQKSVIGPKVYESAVVSARREEVWEYIGDFNSLPKWHPDIEESELTEGRGGVGSVRRLPLEDGGKIIEKLLEKSDLECEYTYTLLETPQPIKNYVATISLSEVTASDETFVEWCAQFDLTDLSAEEETMNSIAEVFRRGLESLVEHFE